MPVDFKNIEKTIDYFEKGTITRERFIDYIKNQIEQMKNDEKQNALQIKAAQEAAKMTRKNMTATGQGAGTTKDLGPETNRT